MIHSIEHFKKLRYLLDIDGIGTSKSLALLSTYQSIDNLFDTDFRTLIKVEGISKNLAINILKSFESYSSKENYLNEELNSLEQHKIKWLTYWSDNYPQQLKNIYSPPLILYYKGTLLNENENAIAIVGTRNATYYGKTQTELISMELVKNNITVVSGLARGIDSVAHKSALKANGRTIAIVGSGLDVIYPPENKNLYNKILENGAIISEFKMGTKPDAQNFPKRNRIISGISLGTLVIESRIVGGALQTARLALDQNREVFAIPGNLGVAQSEGTNLLIQRGEAKLVTSCDDILEELKLVIKPRIGKNIPKPSPDLSLFEQKIYDCLTNEGKHIDLIANETKINSSECLVHLLSLEFKDLVRQLPGKIFSRI